MHSTPFHVFRARKEHYLYFFSSLLRFGFRCFYRFLFSYKFDIFYYFYFVCYFLSVFILLLLVTKKLDFLPYFNHSFFSPYFTFILHLQIRTKYVTGSAEHLAFIKEGMPLSFAQGMVLAEPTIFLVSHL